MEGEDTFRLGKPALVLLSTLILSSFIVGTIYQIVQEKVSNSGPSSLDIPSTLESLDEDI